MNKDQVDILLITLVPEDRTINITLNGIDLKSIFEADPTNIKYCIDDFIQEYIKTTTNFVKIYLKNNIDGGEYLLYSSDDTNVNEFGNISICDEQLLSAKVLFKIQHSKTPVGECAVFIGEYDGYKIYGMSNIKKEAIINFDIAISINDGLEGSESLPNNKPCAELPSHFRWVSLTVYKDDELYAIYLLSDMIERMFFPIGNAVYYTTMYRHKMKYAPALTLIPELIPPILKILFPVMEKCTIDHVLHLPTSCFKNVDLMDDSGKFIKDKILALEGIDKKEYRRYTIFAKNDLIAEIVEGNSNILNLEEYRSKIFLYSV